MSVTRRPTVSRATRSNLIITLVEKCRILILQAKQTHIWNRMKVNCEK